MKRSRARSPEAIEFARAQRATANEFARTVWQWVRNRQICDQKFRREHAIPPYTADFCCVELRLILEIDGADHLTDDGRQRDRVRDDFLVRQGYRVVRIPSYDVLREPSACLERIGEEVQKRMREMEYPLPEMESPSPQPFSPRRGEGRYSAKRAPRTRIIETYQYRKPHDRYSRRVKTKEIEANDFNVNISRYVSTAKAEEEIDLAATHRELVEIEKAISTATAKHNKFLKELGLPPLP